MTPKDIISLQLIDEAKRKLIETNQDISRIVYSLCFEYPTHFTRLFKKVAGITPSEFRIKEI